LRRCLSPKQRRRKKIQKNWIDPPEKWEKILVEKGEEKYSILGSLKKAQFCSECHDVQPPLRIIYQPTITMGSLDPLLSNLPTQPPLKNPLDEGVHLNGRKFEKN